jgi:hypothetical protein
MKKLGFLVPEICVFWLLVFPLSGKGEMSELTEKEMIEQSFDMGDFSLTADLATGSDTETKNSDELTETEEDQLENYLRSKSISATLSVESGKKVDQLEYREYSIPFWKRALSGRTLATDEPQIGVGKHDNPPPNPLNANTP